MLESGGGWIGYWLDRMDGVFGHTAIGQRVPLENPPSYYFRSAATSAAIPTSGRSPWLAERFGDDRFMWASDFPHADHTPEYIEDLDVLAGMFPDESRRKFLGDNCRELFKIDV